jgi:hypothetical protein
MRLFAGEPEAGPWTARPVADVARELLALATSRAAVAGPPVIAVDGRSGAGKSTFAERVTEMLGGVSVIHTDDIAWHHSFFEWVELMRSGVLEPLRRGSDVAYRPPAWIERGRPGAIEVRARCPAVVLEGVGAGRRELTDLVDVLVWVQSDAGDARTRGIARDGGDVAFWDEWEREEVPFLDQHRPWERADLIVAGTSDVAHRLAISADSGTIAVSGKSRSSPQPMQTWS